MAILNAPEHTLTCPVFIFFLITTVRSCSLPQVVDDDLSRTAPLDAAWWQQQQAELSKQGLRVLALCRWVHVY